MKWLHLYLSSQQVCFWFNTWHLKSGRPLLLGVLLWILNDQTCTFRCCKFTAGKMYHSINRNVFGLFQGFTYALFLTNPVNRSKVCIWSKHSFFHWEKLLSFLRVAVAALWWSQKEREICVILVRLVVSSVKLLKQPWEITLWMKVNFFPSLSAKCMPRNEVRCSILFACWASLVRVFPIQKR